MARYLFIGSYTQAGIQGVLKDGGSGRREAVEALGKSVGGSLVDMYWGFGEDDFYVIADLPSQAAAAAVASTTSAAGAATIRTIVLLTAEDMDEVVKLHPAYRAPGA